jgi:hypothetical protein
MKKILFLFFLLLIPTSAFAVLVTPAPGDVLVTYKLDNVYDQVGDQLTGSFTLDWTQGGKLAAETISQKWNAYGVGAWTLSGDATYYTAASASSDTYNVHIDLAFTNALTAKSGSSIDTSHSSFSRDCSYCTGILLTGYTSPIISGSVIPVAAAIPAPTVTGFWPGAVPTLATPVYVFGSNFVLNGTAVKVGGVPAPISQVLDSTLLFFLVPSLSTTGPITITTVNGTASSNASFGTALTGLYLTGFWPAQAAVGSYVFVFGSGFVPAKTQVMLNQTPVSFVQVIDSGILFIMVPASATSGPITVSTSNGSVTSAASFIVVR